MPTEDYAIVLDFLPRGKSDAFKPEPIAQVMGTELFTLLEIVPRKDISLNAGQKIYVGKEERKEVDYIKRRISFKDLTHNSISELEDLVTQVVKENNGKYLSFYNSSGPITIKRHQLELLPGLGQKHMQHIIQERSKKPFESFEDIAKRVSLVPAPLKAIVKRIIIELEDEAEKHHLFTRPPARKKEFRR